jgi:hypothetical protein
LITKTQQLVLEGYKAGLTPKEIARRIGSTRCSVSVIAHRLGVTRSHQERWKMVRGFEVPPEKAEDYRFLTTKKGFRAREAADVLGLLP